MIGVSTFAPWRRASRRAGPLASSPRRNPAPGNSELAGELEVPATKSSTSADDRVWLPIGREPRVSGFDALDGRHAVDRAVERGDATDPGAAIVAWHNPTLNVVAGLDEHRVVLRLLADRDHQITAQRTRTIGRLHALLCLLIEGGTKRALTASNANDLLDLVTVDGPITAERVATARQFVTEIATLDQARIDARKRAAQIITATATTLADIHGIGPVAAAIILGRVNDIARFPTSGHFARHNGTAPIEASSGPKKRHRLNPRGDFGGSRRDRFLARLSFGLLARCRPRWIQ